MASDTGPPLLSLTVDGEQVTVPDDGASLLEARRDRVAAGDVLDAVTLRSYAIGAAHMAFSWVAGESLAVDAAGALTIRSFGIARAVDTPPIDIEIDPAAGPPVNGSDAVFAAGAAAVWLDRDRPPVWPTGRRR